MLALNTKACDKLYAAAFSLPLEFTHSKIISGYDSLYIGQAMIYFRLE